MSHANHPASSSAAVELRSPSPRSEAIDRSPPEAIETTTPRPVDGPAHSSTPCAASARGRDVRPRRRRACPRIGPPRRSCAAHAATFAAWPPAPTRVVAGRSSPGSERRVQLDDDVEDQVAERGQQHAYDARMDEPKRRTRSRALVRARRRPSAPPARSRPLRRLRRPSRARARGPDWPRSRTPRASSRWSSVRRRAIATAPRWRASETSSRGA